MGADLLDGEPHNSAKNKDDWAWNDKGEPYKDFVNDMGNLQYPTEGSREDENNDYTYIEIWPDSGMINDLLLSIQGMLFNMLGMSDIIKTKKVLPIDMSIGGYNKVLDDEGNPVDSELYDKWMGRFNENDMNIYDPMYATKGAFYQAVNSALAKMPGGIIHFAIATVLDSIMRSWYITLPGLGGHDGRLGVIDVVAAGSQ